MSSAFLVLLYLAVVGRVLVLADDVPYGVQSAFAIADIESMLVSPITTWPYSHATINSEIICTTALYTCLGSMSTATDTDFSLFACAETAFLRNGGSNLGTTGTAESNNGAYWYRLSHNAVGFSGISATVNVQGGDTEGWEDDTTRLSWPLGTGNGGYRSGTDWGMSTANNDPRADVWQKVVACLILACPQGSSTADSNAPAALSDCILDEGWRIDSSDLNKPIQCVEGTYCPGLTAVGTATAAAINTDSTAEHHPCDNSINGVATSATDVDGNIILGCNNVVANNTDGHGHLALVDIVGSDNVVSDNVVSTEAGTYNITLGYTTSDGEVQTDSRSSGNEAVGNVADYIDLWSVQNSTAKGNVARNGGDSERGGIKMASDTDVKFSDNAADYMQVNNAFNEVVQRNKITSMDSSTYGYLHIDSGTSDDIEDNTAVRACSFRRAVLGCLALSRTNLCFACCVLLC